MHAALAPTPHYIIVYGHGIGTGNTPPISANLQPNEILVRAAHKDEPYDA